MNLLDNKSQLRTQAKQERLAMPLDDVSASIISQLTAWPVFQQARKVACYSALTHEVNLLPLMTEFAESKLWFLPRIASDTEMTFHQWLPTQSMRSGRFGILEPSTETPSKIRLQPDEDAMFDLVILPALMVDHTGNRLGHGKGYYDRFLSMLLDGCITVAPVPRQHYIAALPTEPHDLPVQFVVTEAGVIEF